MIELSYSDIMWTSGLLLAAAFLNYRATQESTKDIIWSAIRTVVQLSLIGLVLKQIFENANLLTISLIALIMILIAGFEVQKRQKYRFQKKIGVVIGLVSISSASILMLIFAMQVAIRPTPWYDPRYLIPILGMLLGNTMNGLAISLDRLHSSVILERKSIEGRLILGDKPVDAISEQVNTSVRAGLIPIVNAMAAAGLVSLPGLMTGQILGGATPSVAVRYQIFIMLLIATSTILSVYIGVNLSVKKLFDDRYRLRWERLISNS